MCLFYSKQMPNHFYNSHETVKKVLRFFLFHEIVARANTLDEVERVAILKGFQQFSNLLRRNAASGRCL